jgi:hypothetical protein
MSSLLASRPPGWRMREDEGQGSLFGGEALAPPTPTPTPFPRRERPTAPAPEAPADAAVHDFDVAAPADAAVQDFDVAAPADAAVHDLDLTALVDDPPVREAPDAREQRVPLALGAPLAGPTLDDAMSRAWEGLVAGVPAACPVCQGEIEPALGGGLVGHCGTCQITLD